ncbi:MAG: hypothetical protein V4727_10935 [Verrucomicrobiota bacterium]
MTSDIKFFASIAICSSLLTTGCSKGKSYEDKNIERMSAIKSVLSTDVNSDCVDFLNVLVSKNEEKVKFYCEQYGISSDIVAGNYKKMWEDAWGNSYRFTWAGDYSLILMSSDGPNREFDANNGDDIVYIIERKK